MILNKKGFTLVELLATIVLFAIVAGIGTYSISSIIKNSKQKNYELLIKNIKDAAEVYYQECKYAKNDGAHCVERAYSDPVGYRLHLIDLVNYGYLTGNKKNADGSYKIVNPNTDEEIGDCYIWIDYNDDDNKVVVTNKDNKTKCPKY